MLVKLQISWPNNHKIHSLDFFWDDNKRRMISVCSASKEDACSVNA